MQIAGGFSFCLWGQIVNDTPPSHLGLRAAAAARVDFQEHLMSAVRSFRFATAIAVFASFLFSVLFAAQAIAQPTAASLPEARDGFKTKLIPNSYEADGPAEAPAPNSPYQLIKYRSPAG